MMEMKQFNAVAQAIETMEKVAEYLNNTRVSYVSELTEAAEDLAKAFPETSEESFQAEWNQRALEAYHTLSATEYGKWRERADIKPYLERYLL
jgi:recombinational DNA repair ATPase RecF